MKKIWSYLRHPDPKLRFSWYCLQLGIFIFPLFPALAAIGLLLSALIPFGQNFRKIIKYPLYRGFIFLSIFLLITVVFAADKITAFFGLFNLLPFFFLFAGLSNLIQTTWQLQRISWILSINSLPIVFIGIGQLFLGWSSSELWNSIFGWNLLAGGNPPNRMASVFMYANILAGYLAIVFILSLGLWLQEWRRFRRKQGDKEEFSPPTLLFLTFAVITNFAGLILTNSRNAWVIALVACLAYALYQGWRLIVAFVMGIAGSVILAAFAPSPIAELFRKIVPAFFWARFNDQLHPDRPVALMRTTQWNFAWDLTLQRPFTGWGLRSFSQIYETKMNLWLGHPHNLFLMLSAETGLIATLLFCSLLGWIFIKGIYLLRVIPEQDKLIFFSYLLVFIGWILFNTVDVTLFDFRLNTVSWLILGAIYGVSIGHRA
ncbi:lipid A core-O-antigen ligase-like enyme [Rivularia sp. PCC 7116]|uniref:O-antigen ligase family protein n=1 Tax=Rivularia sp. PCC 7116 TaxID=373994 RepID=UPI00029F41F3|nr:O-antigen ligase family protein [Rivularia sp. PCC 7116]AFY53442.1 lipid A core-O-antigen ligase-like enyme [Rivularia sp. PCC 7116]